MIQYEVMMMRFSNHSYVVSPKQFSKYNKNKLDRKTPRVHPPRGLIELYETKELLRETLYTFLYGNRIISTAHMGRIHLFFNDYVLVVGITKKKQHTPNRFTENVRMRYVCGREVYGT